MAGKRQPKRKGSYRLIHARVSVENYAYLNSLDVDSSLSRNLDRIIRDHRRDSKSNLYPT